jgi:UDP-hydrolysing UDP-N-acetyl-D-glucosamine 2-epimerase
MSYRVAVLTSGRQDYGILRSTLLLLRSDPLFELLLIAGGMHLSPQHGFTITEIEKDGFTTCKKLSWLADGCSVGAQMAAVIVTLEEFFREQLPDCLVLVGDRYETAAAALSATTACIPIVHLHGGEETEGAFDNALRHAITKMSHLHLVTAHEYKARVIQMGEQPSTVHLVHAPGVDNMLRDDLPGQEELENHLNLILRHPVVIVTLHPTTLSNDAEAEIIAVIEAMLAVDATYVVTMPNSDPGNSAIRKRFKNLPCSGRRIAVVETLGLRRYFGLMRIADALLGNSSSALVEAPALGLPAVNVGDRQKGRGRAPNIIDAAANSTDVIRALHTALSPEFRRRGEAAAESFSKVESAGAIVNILRSWQPPSPPRKRFAEIGYAACQKA